MAHSDEHIRWISRLMSWAAYGAMIVFVAVSIYVVLSRGVASGVWILWPIALAAMLMLLAMGLGIYATIWVRCSECRGRFYSLITPTFPINWPLQNYCVSCGHGVDVL